jgi:hypothetical protein
VAEQARTKAGNAPAARPFKPALLLILLLPVAAVMAPLAIVVAAAMIPTMVARIVDTSPNRYLTYSVLSLNLVGSMYFVWQAFMFGNHLGTVTLVLQDPIGWLSALVGAGCGWVLFLGLPALAARMAATQSALRLRRVHRDKSQLVNDWGQTVAGGE